MQTPDYEWGDGRKLRTLNALLTEGGATNYGWMGVGKCGEPNFPLFCGSNK